jgi:hypothetical protein
VCVFIAFGILHAMRSRHVVICGLPRSTTFSHFISKAARLKMKIIEHKMGFGFRVSLQRLFQTFFHFISKAARLKLKVIEHKMGFGFLYNVFFSNIFTSKKN